MQQYFGKEYGVQVKHKQDAEWNDITKEKMLSEKQNTLKITKDDVKRKLKSLPDWKGVRPDKIQGFWLKYFSAVHQVLATVLNES